MGLSAISTWPTWVVLLAFSVFFLVVMFGARLGLARVPDEERREEVADLAKSLNGPVGATLAFLVGFAVSITWGAMSTAQSAVERLAAQGQQTALVADGISDPTTRATVDTDLQAYLRAVADQDRVVLAEEEVTEMPSFSSLQTLAHTVRDLSRAAAGGPDAGALGTVQSNVSTMAGIQAELNAVARRALPPVVVQLLVVTGALSAATVGMLAVGVRRPYLIAGWALVIAMGLAVVVAIYNPFAGSVQITFDPLLDAAQRIRNG